MAPLVDEPVVFCPHNFPPVSTDVKNVYLYLVYQQKLQNKMRFFVAIRMLRPVQRLDLTNSCELHTRLTRVP